MKMGRRMVGAISRSGPPPIFSSADAIHSLADEVRRQGRKVVLVPTMGALHMGHQALLRAGRKAAGTGGLLVVSIFVNPTQFGPTEDLDQYPKPFEEDMKVCDGCNVDVVYAPETEDMYPGGFCTMVDVQRLGKVLCGESRPDHFQGVATVVLKLLLAVRPHVAIFGQKDYQQLVVIKQMVKDFGLGVQVAGYPTVREPDGLACSSRNIYLGEAGRRAATSLNRGLFNALKLFVDGERRAEVLRQEAMKPTLEERAPEVKVLYLELRDAENLEPVGEKVLKSAVLAVAAQVDGVRLIDNVLLHDGGPVAGRLSVI